MESTEAIDIPVNTKDAHKHEDRDTDANITKNVQKENPSTIDATGTNIENNHIWLPFTSTLWLILKTMGIINKQYILQTYFLYATYLSLTKNEFEFTLPAPTYI